MSDLKYLQDGPVAAGTAYGALQSSVDWLTAISNALSNGDIGLAMRLTEAARRDLGRTVDEIAR